ncbi:hypothetical protein Patl1_23929 [Pistacia atlantica]|uniref:Uncharacterized protein n=1 Tax=Pistacia atlantica TaxID=434234 RepID=A0ACC0ZXX0_9ROSI|nr:hypothetical protein Patl1_23929 [Pistacia atlantica]
MAPLVETASEMSLGTDEYALQWAEIQRLPTFDRLRTSLFDKNGGKKVIDVTKLEAPEPHVFIEKRLKQIENDNLRLLRKIRERIDQQVLYN